jgi:hypothetical protein
MPSSSGALRTVRHAAWIAILVWVAAMFLLPPILG